MQPAAGEAAGRAPSGIFRTDDGVNPIGDENDPDDWRTAPVYAGSFLVLQRAHPNPARPDEAVALVFRIATFNAFPGGLRLVAFAPDGRRQHIASLPEATTAGTYDIQFYPGEVPFLAQGGLFRLILFDANSEPVTYGDLLVER